MLRRPVVLENQVPADIEPEIDPGAQGIGTERDSSRSSLAGNGRQKSTPFPRACPSAAMIIGSVEAVMRPLYPTRVKSRKYQGKGQYSGATIVMPVWRTLLRAFDDLVDLFKHCERLTPRVRIHVDIIWLVVVVIEKVEIDRLIAANSHRQHQNACN